MGGCPRSRGPGCQSPPAVSWPGHLTSRPQAARALSSLLQPGLEDSGDPPPSLFLSLSSVLSAQRSVLSAQALLSLLPSLSASSPARRLWVWVFVM